MISADSYSLSIPDRDYPPSDERLILNTTDSTRKENHHLPTTAPFNIDAPAHMWGRQKLRVLLYPSLSLLFIKSFQLQHLPLLPQLLPLGRATSLLLSALLSSGCPVLPNPSRPMALHVAYTDNKVHTYFLIVSKLLHHPNYLSFIFSCESHRTWWHS